MKGSQQTFFKIGRTFFSLKQRYGNLNYSVIQIWSASHEKISAIETVVLKQYLKYQAFGPTDFLGRTEYFDIKLPFKDVIAVVDTFFVRDEN